MSHTGKKGYLLATASGIAAVAAAAAPGSTQAADLGLKAPAPAPMAAPSWAGWYIGGSAGVTYQQGISSTQFDPYGYSHAAFGHTTTSTGFIGGGQIGYNWQQGNFVYGVEGDISGLTGTGTSVPAHKTFSNRIDWLSTFRLRGGLAVGDTMVYATGGLAIGGVKNSFGYAYENLGNKSESKTRVGWAIGGGVEHILWNSHWTVGLEGLFVDLGSSTVTNSEHKTAKFSNQAIIGRLKLNYKF